MIDFTVLRRFYSKQIQVGDPRAVGWNEIDTRATRQHAYRHGRGTFFCFNKFWKVRSFFTFSFSKSPKFVTF